MRTRGASATLSVAVAIACQESPLVLSSSVFVATTAPAATTSKTAALAQPVASGAAAHQAEMV